MSIIYQKINRLRSIINRGLYPIYKMKIDPVSRKYGYDRGTPIDRLWIDQFISLNSKYITGSVLEIGDSRYTNRYGTNCTKHVLDINNKKGVDIVGDLQNLKMTIKDNTFDCIILTHVLGLIPDTAKAISEIRRILKPNGVVLCTVSCLSPTPNDNKGLIRLTPDGLRIYFDKYFKPSYSKVDYWGNCVAGQAFWSGIAAEEIDKELIFKKDPNYPCISTIIATK